MSGRQQRATELTRFIGAKVRELRKAQGMTQEALASRVEHALAGFDRTTVVKIETSYRGRITVDELVAIAGALRVDYTELLPEQRQLPDDVRLLQISNELRRIAKRSELNDRLALAWKAAQ